MAITITTSGGRLRLSSPYHPKFAPAARQAGGRWDPDTRQWTFDARNADQVRKICVETYGLDPLAEQPAAMKTVTIHCDGMTFGATISGFGRIIAERMGRDDHVRLHPSVSVVAGRFPGSGGSRAHPSIGHVDDVTLKILDVPEAILSDSPTGFDLVSIEDAEDAKDAAEQVRQQLIHAAVEAMRPLSLAERLIVMQRLQEVGVPS